MSRIPRLSLRKGPKIKPRQETETSFNESGSPAEPEPGVDDTALDFVTVADSWTHVTVQESVDAERKAVTSQEGFQQERKDCESTHDKVTEINTRYTHQLQAMSAELVRTASELETQKKNLANTEAVMQKRDQQLRQQMAEKEHELGLMKQENAKLHEEVQSKTQQVMQYKEQTDKYRQEVESFMEQGVMQKEQVEFFARQADEMKHHNADLKQELERFGREVARREVFERRAAELEGENNKLRQNIMQENIHGDCVRLQQQLQRQVEEATQQSQLLQQRLDTALTEIQHLQHLPQIAPKSYKPWNIPRQEVRISSEIGRGAWGTVYNGKFQGQSVAVKCLHPEILNQRTIERLRREVEIMAQVRHPNLLRFIGAVFDSQVPHQHPPLIVLELLDMNLRMAYETKQLQGSSKIPIFRDIAYALHYLHEHHEPIIHRDVSTPNVLLEALPSGMWRAKVSDFGSANLARLAQTMAEGAIIYAAPETFPRKLSSPPPPQTTKIDVFSYGVLLCEVITSQLPNLERFWIMLQQVEKQWPLMHKLIIYCTNENADERPTMAEVLDQLNALPQTKLN